MAIKKIQMRPEGTNDYADVLHPETSADMVLDTATKVIMTSAERTKLAGIGTGANVTSVAGRTGAVTLAKADVGLALVDNVKQLPATYGNIVTITANTTLSTTHADKVLDCTNSAAITITVPTTLDIGTQITVIRRGAGTVTFAPASGVTLNSKDTKRAIAGQQASATLVKVTSTIWQLIGALE